MKKIYFSLFLIVLLIFCCNSYTFGAELESQENQLIEVGAGLGIPYGIIGGNLEVSPSDYFSLTGGIGITPAGLGWSVGVRVYLLGTESELRPRIGYYYGIVAIRENLFSNDENLSGSAAGLGFNFKLDDNFSIDGDLIYILSVDSASVDDLDSQFKIACGMRYRF